MTRSSGSGRAAASELRAAAAERILIKDGAYGTLIQAEGLKEQDYRGELALNHDQRGNNDLLNLTRPDIVRKIAGRFIDSGIFASVDAQSTCDRIPR